MSDFRTGFSIARRKFFGPPEDGLWGGRIVGGPGADAEPPNLKKLSQFFKENQKIKILGKFFLFFDMFNERIAVFQRILKTFSNFSRKFGEKCRKLRSVHLSGFGGHGSRKLEKLSKI